MIGQTISHYRILKKIGAGGMGEVYLAEDERLGRKLALKILPEQFTQDGDRLRRFEQEARSASALNHPNIITIYEIGKVDGLQFIATEFIEGETLRHLMNSRMLSLNESLDIAAQCASALQAAHSAGITHRDIKPDNIMLRPDGFIKILDFGLAKLTEKSSTTDLEGETRSLLETHPGMIIGTAAYMSPEQARGQRVDRRTDIFSLGVVLYEMVSGRRPFTGATISDMIAALLVNEPAHLSQYQPNVPPELEKIVGRMLAKERESRYQTAQEVLNDLKRVRSRVEFSTESDAGARLEAPTAILGSPSPISSGASGDAATEGANTTNISPHVNRQVSFETNIAPAPTYSYLHVQNRGVQGGKYLILALIALAIVMAAGFITLQYFRRNSAIDSVAVLPFVNETVDPEAEYLSEGIAEGIINSLSQLPGLSVSSRNSVIRYKGREADAQMVGRELGVKAVLLGRISRQGNSLAINTELVNVENGRQIWGEQFSRKISDLMRVQEEIAKNITEKLRLRLTNSQKESMARHGTQNAEAYDLYLKGRYYWNQGTREAQQKADEYFEAAAAKDPDYALAAAGCAACHVAGSDGKTPKESMEKAKLVAIKALKVDGSIVDAHLTLAQVNYRYDWDFPTAELEFKRAIDLDRKNASAHHLYAQFLALMGRHEEAHFEVRRARELDPQSLQINQAIGTVSYYAKQYDDAIDYLRKTIELDKNFAPAHTGLGLAYEQTGKTQDAILEFMRAKRLMGADQESLTALKKSFVKSGRDGFWREYLEILKSEAKEHYVPSTGMAAIYSRLGENDRAIDALEKAYEEKDGGIVELKVEPVFERLRSERKFNELLRRVGLSE